MGGRDAKLTLGPAIGGFLIAALGTAAFWWHNHKNDLREEGRQECIQEVNKETHEIVVEALAAANAEIARLEQERLVAEAAAAEARARRKESESRLASLSAEMEAQRDRDPEYAEWSDTPLPDGVAERLRRPD